MLERGHKIAYWGSYVYVKVPVTNTRGEAGQSISQLARDGVKLNVTAVMTNDLIKLLVLVGKDLSDYSRETVAMFYMDAAAAGFNIAVALEQRS
jgi:transaldolase